MQDNTPKRRGGNIRNSRTTHPYREARRRGALQRGESHANRSVEVQLGLILHRPGQSAREVSRLTGGEFTDASRALTALRNG